MPIAKTWTFEGSNDNMSWNVVDTVASETGWSFGETRTFNCDVTTTPYRYYRMNITANNGDATYTEVNQLNIYGPPSHSRHRVINQ